MNRNNLEYFILMSALVTIAIGGFIAGEPCHEKNTAILQPMRPIWPVKHVHCADMKNMGNNSWYIYVSRLQNVTSVFADNMLLTKLPYKTLTLLPNLEILDVSDNRIQKGIINLHNQRQHTITTKEKTVQETNKIKAKSLHSSESE
ncbi:hypothetical protein Trydic_g16344 [Trypoxylus dichotomus]